MALDSTRVINGSFGKVYHEGQWLTNFNKAQLTSDITMEKVKRAGSRTVGNKPTIIENSGTITGYKITSELIQRISAIKNDSSKAFVTELNLKLDDPDAYGYERIRVKGVQFNKIDIMNFEHGALVEQELPFVFDDFEFLNAIRQV